MNKFFPAGFIRKLAEKKGTVHHDHDNCVFCGKCSKVCTQKAITVNRNERILKINNDNCIRCSRCVKACPKSALNLSKELR